ncbi:MAG: hypothetical protein JJT96_02235 [Opitutales bacterium]|nr:hypothetical protein [Opitutales bacterium]
MASGLLLDLWKNHRPGNGFARKPLRPSIAAVAVVLALTVGYGPVRLYQVEGNLQPGPVIAVIQPDVPLTGAMEGDYDGGQLLRELKAMSEEAALAIPPPQLIVWSEAMNVWPLRNPEYFEQPFAESLFPEIATAGIDLPREEFIRLWDARRAGLRSEDAALRMWVQELGIPLLFGQDTRLPSTGEGQPVFERYNAARLIRPPGNDLLERQYKVRIFPGGEYVPGGRERFQPLARLSAHFSDYLDSIHEIRPGSERERFLLHPPAAAPSTAPDLPFVVSICAQILCPKSSGVFDYSEERPFHVTIASEGRFLRNRAQLITYMSQPFRAIEARSAIARSANTGISGFVAPTGALYGQVTNADGQYRTGLGFAEQAAIERFQERARTFAENPDCRAAGCSPSLELVERAVEIRRIRAEAGVSGFSVARIDISPHGTLYQRIGDVFPRFALLMLGLATLAACIQPQRA